MLITLSLSLSLLAALPAVSGAGDACDLGPSSCEAVRRDAAGERGDDADGPRYATQAVVDCPAPTGLGSPEILPAGECDGTPRDASYRASRDPESERAPGSLRPALRAARRDRTLACGWAACDGNPSEGRDASSSPAPNQPLALFALPSPSYSPTSRLSVEVAATPRSRQLRPLERPPRA